MLAMIVIAAGFLLAVGWSVPMFFARFMAESGPGLTVGERLLVAVPMAVASAMLVGGGNHGLHRMGDAEQRGGRRALFVGGVMTGTVAGLVVVGFVLGV
jgi:hypothetical protein